MSRTSVSDSVVVITGASSGIGRAAAAAFARRGATVVLGARRERALQDVAAECEHAGGRALPVRTDVTDEAGVEALARAAVERFGRLDVWVNNAAVTLFARFEEAPMEVYRRVIETNLFGYIHGARAALPYFRERGSGVLVNVSSVVSETPQPYTSAYTMTKFAIQGLSDSLRMELSLDDDHDIHVCTVRPAAIATPIYNQAANYTGRRVQPLEPIYPAEQVADAIVSVVRRPRREVIVGNAGRAIELMRSAAPGMYERRMAHHMDREHLTHEAAPHTDGNVFEPIEGETSVSGGWPATNLGTPPPAAWIAGGLAVALPIAAGWWLSRHNGRALPGAARPGRGTRRQRRWLTGAFSR